jgi:hypothetical protein
MLLIGNSMKNFTPEPLLNARQIPVDLPANGKFLTQSALSLIPLIGRYSHRLNVFYRLRLPALCLPL